MAENKCSEDEWTILKHFLTNPEGDVYFLQNFADPEVAALLIASYSREQGSLKELLLKSILKAERNRENERRKADGLEKLPKINYLRAENPEFVAQVFKKWADVVGRRGQSAGQDLGSLLKDTASELFMLPDKYGHVSLRDMGHYSGAACESISNIVTVALEEHQLGDYQEKSTRYLEFSEDGVLMPKEFVSTTWEARLNENTKVVMAAYKQVLKDITDHLNKTREKPEGFDGQAWENAKNAYAFDNARYLLPTRIRSNVGLVSNARTLQEIISNMMASNIAEVRETGEKLLEEGRKLFPTLLLNTPPNTHRKLRSQDMCDLVSKLEDKGSLQRKYTDKNDATLVDAAPDLENKILATMLWEHSNDTWENCYDFVRGTSGKRKEQIAEAYLGSVGQKHPKKDIATGEVKEATYNFPPGNALDMGKFAFEIWMDYGAYRDLHRQRRTFPKLRRLLNVDGGYEIPRLVEEIGGKTKDSYIEAMEHTKKLHNELREGKEFQPEVLQYVVNFGFRVKILMAYDAWQLKYQTELRTSPHGHYSYRRIFGAMFQQARAHLPIIAKHIKADLDDYEMGRLKEEQRGVDKAKARGVDLEDTIKPGSG